MEFQGIRKIHQGKFIARYDITYKAVDGREKVYEIISRDRNLTDYYALSHHATDSVVMIMEDEARERILLNREYRIAVSSRFFKELLTPSSLTLAPRTIT